MVSETGGTAILGLVAYVFTAGTLLMNNLLPELEKELEDSKSSPYRLITFFFILIAFFCTSLAVTFLVESITPNGVFTIPFLSDRTRVYLGGVLLITAIGSVTTPPLYICGKLAAIEYRNSFGDG